MADNLHLSKDALKNWKYISELIYEILLVKEVAECSSKRLQVSLDLLNDRLVEYIEYKVNKRIEEYSSLLTDYVNHVLGSDLTFNPGPVLEIKYAGLDIWTYTVHAPPITLKIQLPSLLLWSKSQNIIEEN